MMSHPFEYLRYWQHRNNIHIKHKWNSYDFCTNLWKPNFKQNLYELMKHGNFLMYVAHDVIFASSKD
jgi:hypothetical protein